MVKEILVRNSQEDISNAACIIVSVIVTTYNHGKYIRQCLDSILSQETTFAFEIVIHDDASPDDTAQIIREYFERFPNKIIAILQYENLLSKGLPIHHEYSSYLRGAYIAACEGDDFWIDTQKLQRQVDFLEHHKEYIAVYHDTIVVDKHGNTTGGSYPFRYHDYTFTLDDVRNYALPGQTASMMYRNFWGGISREQLDAFLSCKGIGDRKNAMLLALNGKIFCMKESFSAYRYITDEGTSWSATSRGMNDSIFLLESLREMDTFSKKFYSTPIITIHREMVITWNALISLIKERTKSNAHIFISLLAMIGVRRSLIFCLFCSYKLVAYPFKKIYIFYANYSHVLEHK